MAYFAQLDNQNEVINVIVVDDNDIKDENGILQEYKGLAFLIGWSNGHTNWKQTWKEGGIRKNYAGIEHTYDPQRDAFIPLKPYPSWILIEETCQWTAPVAMPIDDKSYNWDESSLNWIENIASTLE